jgi:AraC family transcriptional regulator, regulatory protein of adaptative response / DNA-3-methyladenine glycosylase II
MMLDPEVCWRAFRGRDRRFDGRFFLAVTSTGVYCRPGCPAKLPQRRNVRFYATPAAAESAGFRACLRCRPDSAPGSAAWTGTSATVTRALRLIDDGMLTHGSLERIALRLGVTSRWLRRLFTDHVGASPLEVARSRRAHFARKLLAETALPVERVAHAAGFGGARRLREAMHTTFHRSPAALRGRRAVAPAGAAENGALALRLPARPPFDPRPILAFLGARAIPGIEDVRDGSYRRTIALASGEPATVEVRTDGVDSVTLLASAAAATDLPRLVARATRAFDLDADAVAIAEHLSIDPRLKTALARRHVRVPGAFDPFEVGVRALVGQQVSVAAARTLLGRIAEAHGTPLERSIGALTHAFPTPDALAAAPLERIGLPGARAQAVRTFAAAVSSGTLDLGAFAGLDETVSRLTALPGIGEWTAQYVALRALGEPDAFPAGDLHVRRALARAGRVPTVREVIAHAEAWRPWRAYAVIALWTEERR